MTKILAINSGSSSLKFQLFEMPEETVIAKGLVERIGIGNGVFTIEFNGEKIKDELDIPNHNFAIERLLNQLTELKIVENVEEIEGVGHRVVHGGEFYDSSVLVTPEVLEKLESIKDLAPLHNPANIMGVEAFQKVLPNVPNVLTFDTAFHQTMPESTYMYAVPRKFYETHGVRKYGAHGTSHRYIAQMTAEVMNRNINELKIISCHIGNGASICAIKNGKSFDTSMGFTPLSGLVMGSRTGDIDPATIPYISLKTGLDLNEIIRIFNNESGLKGLSNISSDLRDIEVVRFTDAKAAQAIDVYINRIKQYIGSYAAAMNGVDVIVFTAGVGENATWVRQEVLEGLTFLGIDFDNEANNVRGKVAEITKETSKVKAFVIPTNEELIIAKDTFAIANK
ncbi:MULTISPECIES: acetate/propionate family kinase [unclassified Gemella]|uniref:acetate/propionate family kinase n=1 Tax=unclassified Gemella TaxID=2624949 RepID=UPI0010744EC9|nr:MULTISPECIES: acetate kinase [unclassified Gemella]MBF0710134.1 acetate kinase [Gemella sp. GL1.1]MBF0746213.1 acetate kinase [Gemella sp. 19428wG2_WT2a]NYS27478.1 acetate kinase [Gemella sp. GL1]TFU60497.1 acetate kinase [Gemella sp. WT2a]